MLQLRRYVKGRKNYVLIDNESGFNVSVELLKEGTVKANELLRNYYGSFNFTLDYCYTNYSREKERIQEKIFFDMQQFGGFGFKICTYCKMFFTCGYCVIIDGIKYLVYETPSHRYLTIA